MIVRSVPLLTIVVTALLLARGVFAGGSVGWEDVRGVIDREDPTLCAWVERTFEVRESGGGMRVGRQADGRPTVEGAEVGERMPPYEFPAKPKGSAGDYTLYLTFDYTERDEEKKPLWHVTIRRILPSD
jgi:hypothetical protein